MLHFKCQPVIGSGRRLVHAFLRKYHNVLVICAPHLVGQWRRMLEMPNGGTEFTIMERDEFFRNGIQYSRYDCIVVEDYPMIVHAPRKRYDGESYLAHIIDAIGNNSVDVVELL